MALSAFLRCLAIAALLAASSAPFAAVVRAHEQGQAYGTQAIIRLANNRPAVMVTINGQGPFLFLIDTATSSTIVTPALRERLAIPMVPGPAFDVVTAAGSARSHFYSVAEMGAAGVIVEGVRAVVMDLPDEFGIAGALGADFLSNFIVDLDMPARKVTLYPYNAEVRVPGLRRLQGELNAHGFIVVPARVSNVIAAAVFDSGAQYTVANARLAAYARSVGISTVERPIENKVTDAAGFKRWAISHDFDKISLGPASWLGVRVMISDMRVFDQIGLGGRPAIFIGMDMMGGRRVVIDYGTASLWLRP